MPNLNSPDDIPVQKSPMMAAMAAIIITFIVTGCASAPRTTSQEQAPETFTHGSLQNIPLNTERGMNIWRSNEFKRIITKIHKYQRAVHFTFGEYEALSIVRENCSGKKSPLNLEGVLTIINMAEKTPILIPEELFGCYIAVTTEDNQSYAIYGWGDIDGDGERQVWAYHPLLPNGENSSPVPREFVECNEGSVNTDTGEQSLKGQLGPCSLMHGDSVF